MLDVPIRVPPSASIARSVGMSRTPPEALTSIHDTILYAKQVYAEMGQEGQGYTDEQFLGWAQEAGLSGGELETFQQCVADDTHADYVDAMQERANRDGVTGTPTMVVNGTTIGNEEMSRLMQDPGSLDEIIEANS